MESRFVYFCDLEAFMKEAAKCIRAAQDDISTIKLAIRDSRALIRATRVDIAHLDSLARWRVGEAGLR